MWRTLMMAQGVPCDARGGQNVPYQVWLETEHERNGEYEKDCDPEPLSDVFKTEKQAIRAKLVAAELWACKDMIESLCRAVIRNDVCGMESDAKHILKIVKGR